MFARLVTGLALMTLIKVGIRYTLIGAFTPPAVLLFSIIDAAMTIVMTPWASMGRPLAPRNRALPRALLVATVSSLVLALVNTALQAPNIYYGSLDLIEAVLRLALEAFPRSFFINPIGGIVVILISTAVGWAWMQLRLPKGSGRGGPGGAARGGGGARRAQGGRAGRPAPPPGARRTR